MYSLFSNIEEKEKVAAIDDLLRDSTPRPSFFFLVILSMLMATCGLLLNNSAVVIGSMLIAPILSPIMSLGLGIVMAENKIIARSFYAVTKASGYGILAVVAMTWLFGFSASVDLENAEIMSRTTPSILFLVIAIVAGLATAYARVRPDLNEALPGTAIAVALVPPLAVTGIGIATLDWVVASGAFQMFILNVIGIILASMFMFSLMNLYTKRNHAMKVSDAEERELAQEKAEAEKAKKK